VYVSVSFIYILPVLSSSFFLKIGSTSDNVIPASFDFGISSLSFSWFLIICFYISSLQETCCMSSFVNPFAWTKPIVISWSTRCIYISVFVIIGLGSWSILARFVRWLYLRFSARSSMLLASNSRFHRCVLMYTSVVISPPCVLFWCLLHAVLLFHEMQEAMRLCNWRIWVCNYAGNLSLILVSIFLAVVLLQFTKCGKFVFL
jgi:hypothetical protein